jgi:TRAP-type transport system small permease protein
MNRLRQILDLILEVFCLGLLSLLAGIVLYAVAMRSLGASPGWYDELASALLAWLTWAGGAYAALRGAHMTTETVLVIIPHPLRAILFLMAEAAVFTTMAIVLVAGLKIIETLAGESLVSLPWMPRAGLQAVLPASAGLFMICRALALPAAWKRIMAGHDADAEEIAAAIVRAKEMHATAAKSDVLARPGDAR